MNIMYKRILIGITLVFVLFAIRYSGIHTHLTLEVIRANSMHLQKFIAYSYATSVALFIALFALIVSCAIPLSPLMTVASGYFFQTIPGTLYSIVGATLGATISFFVFRYLLRDYVQKKYGERLKRFNKEFRTRGASYLLFLQLLPITPFGVIAVISGLSTLPWWTFVWTTAVGIAPGSFIYAFAGRQLMTIEKMSDILSWPVIVALSLLALFSLLPIVVRTIHQRP
jgi:uncharacterized membrane protein YdjX (TVP38/TMEM64 family)